MLFTPFQLGRKRLRNRIVFPAVVSMYGQQNRITDRMIDFYSARAEGGAAMIVTEGLSIHPSSVPAPGIATIFEADNFEGFRRMAEAVERHDCRLVGQLWHVGRQALWNPVEAPVGVSSLPDAYSWSVPHVMDAAEVRAIITAFVESAQTLRRAGFSGVELHGGHGYLITQFLSPWSNVRDDEYGGDLERRTRFVRDIVAGIRATCGDDFIVGLKMSGDEGVKGGIDGDEAGRIAARLAAAGGLDYLGFAQGNFSISLEDHTPDMNYAPGPFMDLQKRLRGQVGSVAMLAFGRVLDADHAETLLAEGTGDLIAMGRALVADAALPVKAQTGRSNETRPCIFCNVCWGEIHSGKPIACLHNPQLGTPREATWSPQPAKTRRKVVIAGSGVAGLEAAWVAASRGHEVVLIGPGEAGGKTRLDARLPGRAEVGKVFGYQLARARAAGVRLEMGALATADSIAAHSPDVVVLATGSTMRRPALSAGSELAVDAREFVAGFAKGGGRRAGTAVLFDQDHGAATYALADLLAATYERVVVLTPRTQLGRTVPYVNLIGVYRRLYKAGAEIIGASLPTRLEGGTLTCVNAFSGAEQRIDGVTLFTYATPRIANDALAAPLRARGFDVRLIGDAFAPRAVLAAVHEGNRTGCEI